jgi:hypothetical protein
MSRKDAKKNPSPPAASFEASLLEAGADQALDRLQLAADRARALLQAWIATNNAAALQAVANSDSPLRKEARRALGILKSRGVAIPEHRTAAAPARAAELAYEAWLVPPDATGVMTYTFGSHSVGERWEVADIRLHDEAGLIEVNAGEATRSSVRTSFNNMRSQRGFAPVSVPVPWARWRVARARDRNAQSGLVLPLGLDAAAPLLQPVPETEPKHPIDEAQLAVEDSEIARRAQSSASLHNEPEFAAWLPDIRAVQELLAKVGERLGPTASQQTSEQVNAVFEQEIVAATDRVFTPDLRNALANRMKDCAVSVLARAGRDRALDVLATAEAARRAGLITSPPSEIPFLRTFLQKALAVVASSSGGKLSVPIPPGASQPLPSAEPT